MNAPTVILAGLITFLAAAAGTAEFTATGPAREMKLPPEKLNGAVKVTFDLLPTTMSFDLPWHFCSVAENGLKFAHFAAETYDPRRWDGQGADASFEPGMDKEGRFARVWVEHQSPARIVVRVRYALNNSHYDIAHDDLPTDSPYNAGKGDWAEERFTIYPDGTYARHMRVHTGLAAMSQPTGWFREPPAVVHEFMESVVIGPAGHTPADDLHTNPAISLYKMFGNHPVAVFAGGARQDVPYEMPAGPPQDYGDFRDANIMLIHAKSQYRPFTIALPHGVKASPYGWERERKFPFATWTGYSDPSIGYISAIGHLINYWHFRRTERTIEQVYLHGMTNAAHPQAGILRLAWSWIAAPELQMPGARKSPNGSTGEYNRFTFDQTQRAYIVPRTESGPAPVELALVSIYDDIYLRGTMWLVNPCIIVPEWNSGVTGISVKLDGTALRHGPDYRFGFETTATGKDLVVWLQKTLDLTEVEDHRAAVSILPADN
jgi:hypothetical protein